MDTGAVLIALALLVLTVPLLGGPFLKQQGKKRTKSFQAVEPVEERQTVLLAVRDLDFDFNTGKVAEEDYRRLRTQLLAKAASLAPLPETRKAAAKQVNSFEPEDLPSTERSCPKCDSWLQAGDLFCSGCGAAISRLCSACGNEVDNHANFCSFCGKATAAEPENNSSARL